MEHDGFGSDIVAGILALKKEYALPIEHKAWMEYATGYIQGSQMPEKFWAHELNKIESYLKNRVAKTDQHAVKGDPFTEDLTPPEMVDNLLETGTPFDYKDIDFGKVVKLVQKHKHQPKDILHVLAPALTVGEDSNPGQLPSAQG